jgi:predicted porin
LNVGGQRPLSRVWDAFVNVGYSTNSRLQPLSQFQLTQCGNFQTSQTACPANNAGSYNYGFAGVGMHRAFSRELHAYFSYQFNRLAFATSFCGTVPCNRISNQSLVTFGLDWTPRPMRID